MIGSVVLTSMAVLVLLHGTVVVSNSGWAYFPVRRRRRRETQPEPPPDTGAEQLAEHVRVPTPVRPPLALLPAAGPAVDVFAPRTVGPSSKHAHHPWRLPPQPAQSGVAADQATVGDLVVRAASVVGIGHRLARPAMARQDSYRLGTDTAGEHLVIAVSDGVGGAPLSELGATIACRAAVDAVRAMLDTATPVARLDAGRVFKDAARFMAGAADQRGVAQRDLAAVMAVTVIPVRADGWGRRQAWCAWLGDASVWQRADAAWHRLAGDAKGGLDRNHVAAALPQGFKEARSTVIDLGAGTVITVVSDGVGDALARSDSASWFAARWQRAPALASFLMDVDFDARQTTDDRTAVTVWCGTGAGHER